MKHIIVVEDEELMREVLTRHLEKEKYQVSTFASAEEAFDNIMTDPPDLVLSDVKMPGMSGPDLIELIRGAGIAVPVIFLTGGPTDDIQSRAIDLGVIEILEKPLKDLSCLSLAVENALSCPGYEGVRIGLDELRLNFLTGLAHELRTPITALRLSLDELFAQQSADGPRESQNLVKIGQRNLDRVVSLVEKQINQLQTMLGSVCVSRQLVEVREIIDKALDSEAADGGPSIENVVSDRDRIYLFTDPERLLTVLEWAVGTANGGGDGVMQLLLDDTQKEVHLVVRSNGENRESGAANPCSGRVNPSTSVSACPIPFITEFKLEERACRTIIEALGGKLWTEGREAERLVCLDLPILPSYDRRKDFTLPMKRVREMTRLQGKSMDLLKCEIINHSASTGSEASLLYELLEGFHAALTKGDVVIRGKRVGMCYLALVDRQPEEIDHTIRFLRTCWEEMETDGRDLDIIFLQRVTPDSKDVESLLATIDNVF
ncbi:MAG: response regulator [Candidatus Latescibacteria bacterium]|nr:response regulator [Candidatus Latescibacterota bacterium]NIM22342.1 response regulator [Candidatus Latescibacterota bacterium]NIM66172.1 response regulator [Candidatus Latescibacterota bacterium]NIO02580.1 response regulator [Candidatus Latescibacterota bacterium]NIO29494.1 response regulator [Candidatus Latescibacterota bacterium]